jgi:ribosomal protein S27E
LIIDLNTSYIPILRRQPFIPNCPLYRLHTRSLDKEGFLFKYERHEAKNTLLYKIIEEHYPAFVSRLADEGRVLPIYIHREFEDYLKCGLLEYGFLRVRCEDCHHERMLAFSCKHRGFCPSCCAKRMTESSALLVDTVLPVS